MDPSSGETQKTKTFLLCETCHQILDKCQKCKTQTSTKVITENGVELWVCKECSKKEKPKTKIKCPECKKFFSYGEKNVNFVWYFWYFNKYDDRRGYLGLLEEHEGITTVCTERGIKSPYESWEHHYHSSCYKTFKERETKLLPNKYLCAKKRKLKEPDTSDGSLGEFGEFAIRDTDCYITEWKHREILCETCKNVHCEKCGWKNLKQDPIELLQLEKTQDIFQTDCEKLFPNDSEIKINPPAEPKLNPLADKEAKKCEKCQVEPILSHQMCQACLEKNPNCKGWKCDVCQRLKKGNKVFVTLTLKFNAFNSEKTEKFKSKYPYGKTYCPECNQKSENKKRKEKQKETQKNSEVSIDSINEPSYTLQVLDSINNFFTINHIQSIVSSNNPNNLTQITLTLTYTNDNPPQTFTLPNTSAEQPTSQSNNLPSPENPRSNTSSSDSSQEFDNLPVDYKNKLEQVQGYLQSTGQSSLTANQVAERLRAELEKEQQKKSISTKTTNFLPWILGGLIGVGLIAGLVIFLIRKQRHANETKQNHER